MTPVRIAIVSLLVAFLLLGAWVLFVRAYYGEQTGDVPQNVRFQVSNVAPGIEMLQASGGNITLVTSNGKHLLIDNEEPHLSAALLEMLAALGVERLEFVINTHSHLDHTGGNPALLSLGVDLIAHRAAIDAMRSELSKIPSGWNEIAVVEEHRFAFGDQHVQIFHAPLAHTDGDLLIKFEPADVVVAGDVMVANGLPYLARDRGATLEAHLRGQDILLSLVGPETIIVPGHGELSDRSRLVQIHRFLGKVDARLKRLRSLRVPGRAVRYFHPLAGMPDGMYRGNGWEKFWLGLAWDGTR